MPDSRIFVQYNDPSVHCVDVANGAGDHVLRIRPYTGGGASITVYDPRSGQAVWLSDDDLRELCSALDRLAR